MKLKSLIALLVTLSLALGQQVFALSPSLPIFSPLVFSPPKPQRLVLPNGLVIYLLEDHELPLIHVGLLVKAGSQYDPADKIGLGAIFGPAMTAGGSLNHSPDEILRILDITGGSISFAVSNEDASGSMNCRATDFDKIFGLF